MKIAILHSGDLEKVSMGGVDRYIKSLIEFFDDDEITVYGTCQAGKCKINKEYRRTYHGKSYTFIPITDDRRRPLSAFYMLKEFFYVNKLTGYDCIYAQRTEYSIPFIISRKGRNKLVQIIHGSSKYSEIGFGSKMAKIHLLFEKISMGIAKKTFVILNRPEFGVPYYKRTYKKYKNRISYARNPINPNTFCRQDQLKCRLELGLPLHEKTVIFTGRVEHNPKRVLLIPKICEFLNSKDLKMHFVIVGDGSDKVKMEGMVDQLGLNNQFSFVGYVEDSSIIAKYYNASDIAINISMFEGTCTSNLEALSTGLPIVSTDVGDIHEVLDGRHNGIIIENSNDDSKIVSDASRAITDICKNSVTMDNAYLKYSGPEVVRELRRKMSSI